MGNCLSPIEFGKILKGGSEGETTLLQVREFSAKAGRQCGQGLRRVAGADLAVAGGDLQLTLMANGVANVLRNIWANAVIFCGHFPDRAEKFTKTEG